MFEEYSEGDPEPLCKVCSDSYKTLVPQNMLLSPPCPNQIIIWCARRARRYERARQRRK